MNNPTTILEAVAERDVDLLILEEVHSSPEFFSWLIEAVLGEHPTTPTLLGAWHSVSDPGYGELDLLLLFHRHAEEKFAFLLENKVDAPAQPGQAERYRQRGQKGTVDGEWGDFKTVIFAPQAYLEGNAEAARYDARISYEAVRDWFRSTEPRSSRTAYRAGIIQQAIDQSRRGYAPKVDARVTKFFHDYWLFASREFPELEMPEPGGKPAQSTWAGFRPKGVGKGRHLWHKMDVGHGKARGSGLFC